MVTNPKGYKPKKKRIKYPLTVEEQRKLIDGAERPIKALIVFILSTGAHPSVLTDAKHNLDLTSDRHYSWNRPKTGKAVGGSWSAAMLKGGLHKELKKLSKRKVNTLWYFLADYGGQVEIKGLCPLQLRHTHFANMARLGYDPFTISHRSGTSISTIQMHYTIGLGEMKKLTDTDRKYLEWLMEA
jgi:integrase